MTHLPSGSDLPGLTQKLNDKKIDHETRAEIGTRLAAVGDPRRGVGVSQQSLPDIMWLMVEDGEIQLDGHDDIFRVPQFYISRYIITVAQYRVFLEAEDGYDNPRWWQNLIWDREPPSQANPHDNHPVENVSWYDAVAYCRWLLARVRSLPAEIAEKNPALSLVHSAGWQIRLPTEWEWQQAATGGDANNVYPWGGEEDGTRANTAESGLGRATAVGIYPHGASRCGAMDMAGNMFEWCLNEYDDPTNYHTTEEKRRALRGGSWFHYLQSAKTTARDHYTPQHRFNLIGFRVVCSLPPSPFRPPTAQ